MILFMKRGIIKFLTSDEVVFLCPYCMRHVCGIISKCPHCERDISKDVDLRTTEEYRRKNGEKK